MKQLEATDKTLSARAIGMVSTQKMENMILDRFTTINRYTKHMQYSVCSPWMDTKRSPNGSVKSSH